LLQGGYIIRTPRGRVATEKAYNHLGRKMVREGKHGEQKSFF